ncbi:MAG: molybdopterin-dependent oxidoreductase, partial [Chloroflexi bacterium]|nr:molybdopterin-dependent oxidoreductase [Chloroflexota bacterium]
VIRAVPEIQAPANHGQACFRGKFGMEYVNHRDRLKRPLIRRDGELQETTWDEALGYIAERLRGYKGEQFAAVASARSTNEAAYLLQKFTRTVMETNSVDMDSNGRPGLTRALSDTLGYAASTNSIWELEKAGCVLVVDANVTEEQNVVAVPVKKAVRAGTAKLIVIDAREVELTHYAHIWLRPRPDTTLHLLGGMLRYILDEALAEPGFIEERCEGLDELRTSLEVFDLDAVSRITGVEAERVREAATMFATTGPASILYALDNVPQEQQPMNVYAMTNLALVTGNVGRPSTGLYALHRGTNQQGALDVGCVPDLLPGYQQMDESPGQHAIQAVWGQRAPRTPGLGIRDALTAAQEGTIKSMLLLGDSIDYSSGELGDGYAALQKLEFLVVHDAFLGAAAQLADVVLPAATFAEEDGTYTNLERRVQLLKRVITARNSEAQPAWWLLSSLAHLMNAPGFEYSSPAEVFDEIAQVTPIYAGISHARLVREAVVTLRPDPGNPQPTQMLYSDRVSQGIQWPCPDADGPATPMLYEGGFPDDKANLMPLEAPATTQLTTDENPLLLVPGRVLAQWDREVEVIRTDGMNHIQREELLELHPQDAATLDLSQGDAVEVSGEGWHVTAAAYITEAAHPGVVSMTTLFGELAARLETSEDPDPMSKISGLRVCPVRVKKIAL